MNAPLSVRHSATIPERTRHAFLQEAWWVILGVVIALLVAVIYLPDLPPQTGCTTDRCKEGREWFSVLVTVLVITGGVFQYRNAQQWKRSEWIANETASFFNDPRVMSALYMLDWNRRRLPLLEGETSLEGKYFLYTTALLDTALYSGTGIPKVDGKDRPFTDDERAARDYFDRMLDRLERFEIFLKQGLVSFPELRPYLAYWIELIGNENFGRKPAHTIETLWRYIDDYGFSRVQDLCARFGYNIRPPFPSAVTVTNSDPPHLR